MEQKENKKEVQSEVQLNAEPFANPPIPHVIQRVEGGKFKAGVSANPHGRSRATAKKIERMKSYMDMALSDRWARYLEALDSLNDKDFVAEYRALMEFRFPKLQRVDSTNVNVEAREKQQIKIGDNLFVIN